jgi:hypothetical protein
MEIVDFSSCFLVCFKSLPLFARVRPGTFADLPPHRPLSAWKENGTFTTLLSEKEKTRGEEKTELGRFPRKMPEELGAGIFLVQVDHSPVSLLDLLEQTPGD